MKGQGGVDSMSSLGRMQRRRSQVTTGAQLKIRWIWVPYSTELGELRTAGWRAPYSVMAPGCHIWSIMAPGSYGTQIEGRVPEFGTRWMATAGSEAYHSSLLP
jgi:hypothetical protein